jgi:CubicO group peptidase (beta-lactamase class C family)
MRRQALGAATIGLVISVATVACATSSEARSRVQSPSLVGETEQVLDSYRAKGISDGVVLIAQKGIPVFRKAFGLADREWGIPNAPYVEFGIGSMTKQFTAMAVLQLSAKGKLSLDDPISKFIPTAPPAWQAITIRHLLTHTSGIPDHNSLPDWVKQTWAYRSPDDLIGFLRDRPLDFPPGSKFQYDNAGYVILGSIVQKVTGQSLGDYLKAHVFTPLRMKHTGFIGEEVLPHRASGYEHDGTRWLAEPWMTAVRDSGAGGIYSNADDLLTWDQALYEPSRFGLSDLRPMFTDYGHGYGFGYVIDKQNGHPLWWHNGHGGGFSSIIARYPEDKLTIIVLCNDEGAPIGLLSHALADIYLKLQPR